MANTKSAIKRMRQNETRRLRNRTVRSRVRTVLKTARGAAATPGDEARTAVHVTSPARYEAHQLFPIASPECLPAGFVDGDEDAG